MDPLRELDIREARETPPGEKLSQAFELMASGFRLKRDQLRRQNPRASNEDIERLFAEWLLDDD